MANSKRQLTMQQAIVVMVIGGLMLLLAIVIPTEEGSSAQMWKLIMGLVGFCILGAHESESRKQVGRLTGVKQ
jgi:hypothetical protein